jgi:hypothetical protein
MSKKVWVYDPHSGGVKIPEAVRERTRRRILAHAEKHYAGKYTRIDVRFHGQLCYIDAYKEPYVSPGFDPAVFGESCAYSTEICHSVQRKAATCSRPRLPPLGA